MVINPQDCPTCNPQQYQQRQALKAQQGELQKSIQVEQQQAQRAQVSEQGKKIQQLESHEHDDSLSSQEIDQQVQQKMQLLDQIGHELQVLQQQQGGAPSSTSQSTSQSTSNRSRNRNRNRSPPSSTGPLYSTDANGVITPTQPGKGTLTEPQQESSEEALFYQQHPDATSMDERDPSKSVNFCIACVTEQDARLFLNGEPSACSVIPYPNLSGSSANG